MAKINVSLPDGSKREFEAGISLLDIAKSLNQKLGKTALLAKVDGVNKDLADSLDRDAAVEFITPDSPEGLHAIRHTASHVMAQAIQHLFPGTKFAIGPAIEKGFYYDLDSEHVFTPDDLKAIEKEMAKIVKQNLPVVPEPKPLLNSRQKMNRTRLNSSKTCRKMLSSVPIPRATSRICVRGLTALPRAGSRLSN